jgi:hypothetical protein
MPLFSPEALSSLLTPGIGERWAAVQEQLHPILAELAGRVGEEAGRRFPRQWPLYEVSYKAQRYVNRGKGGRAPIDDYHVAFDRMPRGAGLLVSVSGTERAVLVGLISWGSRKDELRRVWETGHPVWLPLAERIEREGQARFTESPRPAAGPQRLWIERYLDARGADYLWAGFVYRWDALPDAERLVEDVLALFPLNEALMEEAEALEPAGAALLREGRNSYASLPPPEAIVERIQAQGFALSDKLIRAYHIALQTKPLVILPGISGTGKTRLTRLYADAVHEIPPGAPNPYYLLVAVQPDWHSARDLLGYYNALNGTYQPTPFLRLLMRAASDPQQPYYVCLDEMNLARPEYYLAPLLSALETTDHTVDIGVPGDEAKTAAGETLANPFRLPLNVSLIGTVNVDESTHALSDKLLDRANVIELTDVDLEAFRQGYRGAIDAAAWRVIVQVHGVMTRLGQPFGYRTIGEMLRYVEQARGVLPPQQALDLQIKQKILPKLRGEDGPRLRDALTQLLALFAGVPMDGLRAPQLSAAQLASAPLPESAEKLSRMLDRLDLEGFTDFYG